MKASTYREVSDNIVPCLGGMFPKRQLPDDVVLFNVAGQFDVHFVVFAEHEHGRERDIVITTSLMKGWRVRLETLADTAGWNGGELAVWDWPAVEDGLRLFQYPEQNEHWISHIVCPGCLLEHTDVPGPPIVMIPNATTVFIAGLPDGEAQAKMFELSAQASLKGQAITRRPLMIDENWKRWRVLPDAHNPFASEYAEHFGSI